MQIGGKLERTQENQIQLKKALKEPWSPKESQGEIEARKWNFKELYEKCNSVKSGLKSFKEFRNDQWNLKNSKRTKYIEGELGRAKKISKVYRPINLRK